MKTFKDYLQFICTTSTIVFIILLAADWVSKGAIGILAPTIKVVAGIVALVAGWLTGTTLLMLIAPGFVLMVLLCILVFIKIIKTLFGSN